MDILDEIDTSIREKRSKWNYTPMREKSETDALIDELLREFSSDSTSNRSTQKRSSYSSEQAERMNYETQRRTEKNSETVRKNQPENAPRYEEKYDNQEYEDDYYEDEEYDDEYYEDEEYDEFEDERVNMGSGKNNDFDSFMDSENDGQKGDIPKLSVSSFMKIIAKIIVLAVFGAFSIVGIINTASVGYEKYFSSDDDSSKTQKKDFEKVIYPLIVTETEDFDNSSDMSDESIINVAVWEMIINGNKEVFKDSESGEYILPQEQLSYIVDKLFGEDFSYSNTSTEILGKNIEYDRSAKQYILPEDTNLFTYYPVVTDIAEAGDTFTVYADCYSSLPSWNTEKSAPSKRVMVTLNKTSEYYNIVSLKTIPVE